MNERKVKCYEMRQRILDMIVKGNSGHIGGDFSVIEILASIFDRMDLSPEKPNDPDRDRYVHSKGHTVEALYAVLADKGFLDIGEVIDNYCRFGSEYIGHPHNSVPGIEMCSGSLGHGLSVAVGMALAGKMDARKYRVYTVMGDGEIAEGSVWEAFMAGAHYRLDNLCAVIDRNFLQISGNTEDVMAHGDLAGKLACFGWNVIEVNDGNDTDELDRALDAAEACKGRPTVIIAHTVKGCGASIAENKAAWHHRIPNEEEYALISAELKARKEALLSEQ